VAKKKLSHIDTGGMPAMVDVSAKHPTVRRARAEARVVLGKQIMRLLRNNELDTGKGPVFQTAILAGIMGAKNTSSLIPLCHPIALDDCRVTIVPENASVRIEAEAVTTAKTGVEMEALMAAGIAALTVYDMCKAISHTIEIESVRLLEKTGGKEDFSRK
jgi:cyclic pyranopterin phosphate synthase